MPSATNLISFLRSVESHRTHELQLKFAGEVLWGPIFSRTFSQSDLNRFRWVHDRMNECWFALLVHCRMDSGV